MADRFVVEERPGKGRDAKAKPFVVVDSRSGIVVGRRATREEASDLAIACNWTRL